MVATWEEGEERRGNSDLTDLKFWVAAGLEFCVRGSRIFREVWVADFALMFRFFKLAPLVSLVSQSALTLYVH